MELTTYLSPSEYEEVKGINLKLELAGSSDHPEKDDTLFIYRTERKVINILQQNYDFKESDITQDNYSLNDFKLGICEQIENDIRKGIDSTDNPTICDSARGFLRPFMNFRRI